MLTADHTFYLEAAVVVAVFAAWLAWALTPGGRAAAIRWGAGQVPRSRGVHLEPVPRLGGLAIYFAFAIALLTAALCVHFVFGKPLAPRAVRAGIGLLASGTLLSLLGILDDLREIPPGKQLA